MFTALLKPSSKAMLQSKRKGEPVIQRDNRHILIGIGFVVAAIAIAGAVYFGMKLGADSDVTPQEQPPIAIAQVEPNQPPAVVEDPKVIEPKVDDSAIYAAIQGVSYRKDYCEEGEGPSISFDQIGTDDVTAATIYDYNREGHVTNVIYQIANGNLTMTAESVEDADGNELQAQPKLVNGTIKVINENEILIGDNVYYSCGY